MRHNNMPVAVAMLLAPSLLAGWSCGSSRQAASTAAGTFGKSTSTEIRFSPLVEYPAREDDSSGSLQICLKGIQFTAHGAWWCPIPYSSIWFVEVVEGAFVGFDTLYVYSSKKRWAFQIGKKHNVSAIRDSIWKRAGPGPKWTHQPLARYEKVRWESFGSDTSGHLAVYAEGIQYMAGPSLLVSIPYPAMWSVNSKERYWRQDTLYVEAAARMFRFHLPRQTDVTALAADIRQRAGL